MLMFQPVGGMDRIPYALPKAIAGPDPLRRRGAVDHDHDDGVEVIYHDGSGETTATGPTSALHASRRRSCAGSREPRRRRRRRDCSAAARTPPARSGSSTAAASGRRTSGIYGGITDTNMDLPTIWYPSYGYLGDAGVLIGYYNFFANADRYGS